MLPYDPDARLRPAIDAPPPGIVRDQIEPELMLIDPRASCSVRRLVPPPSNRAKVLHPGDEIVDLPRVGCEWLVDQRLTAVQAVVGKARWGLALVPARLCIQTRHHDLFVAVQ